MSEYFDGADIAIAVEEKEKKMTKRHCFVTQVGDAIEALATALDPERKPPFKGDILDLLEWAERDALEMHRQVAERNAELKRINHAINDVRVDLTITASEAITELRQQLTSARAEVAELNNNVTICVVHMGELRQQLAAKQAEVDALMLEYCPSEMSKEQLEEWGRNQLPTKEN